MCLEHCVVRMINIKMGVGRMDKEEVVHVHNGILLGYEKEWI